MQRSPRSEGRLLSDDDVAAIVADLTPGLVAALEERMVQRFYGNLGRGLWGWIWKAVVAVMLLAAAYGAGGQGALTSVSASLGK